MHRQYSLVWGCHCYIQYCNYMFCHHGGPGSIPVDFMWDLWWTKSQFGRFSSSNSVCPGGGIAPTYGLDGRVSIPGRINSFSSSQRRDRLWGPPSVLSNGYGGAFSTG
jgi:hypothetical protein